MKKILIISSKSDIKKFDTFMHPEIEKEIIMDNALINAENHDFLKQYNLIFLRVKNMAVVNFLKKLNLNIPIINPLDSVLIAFDRYKALSIVEKTGVKVPKQFRNTEHADCEVFKKNPMDVKTGDMEKLSAEGWNKQADTSDKPIYGQEYINSEWEYKIYFAFDKIWCFKHKPDFLYPDNKLNRIPIKEDAAPSQQAIKAAKALGLYIASFDFLMNEGHYYLTDVNINAGIQHMESGYIDIMPKIIKLIS